MSGRIAYLGPEGTFCEEALIGMVGAEAAAAEVPYPSIAACFNAVESGEVAEALVPIENALEGGVSQTLDQLMAHDGRIVIRGEVIHPIRHHLIGRKGLALADVTRVLSHPHAPGQCARFLGDQVPQAEVAASLSTADAVRTVMAGDAPEAAIGTARAAEIYGGAILADDIGDVDENHTRFVLVGRDEVDATGPGAFTTSIICAIPTRGTAVDSSGVLAAGGQPEQAREPTCTDRARSLRVLHRRRGQPRTRPAAVGRTRRH